MPTSTSRTAARIMHERSKKLNVRTRVMTHQVRIFPNDAKRFKVGDTDNQMLTPGEGYQRILEMTAMKRLEPPVDHEKAFPVMFIRPMLTSLGRQLRPSTVTYHRWRPLQRSATVPHTCSASKENKGYG